MDEDEPMFKMAHNNPEEAAKFVTKITILVEDFMIDINGYDRYKQEDAYPEFVRKYVKELKTLDDYFKDASPTTVLDIIDDKLCNYIRKPPPDPKAIKIRTSEENIPCGHHILQQLAHEQPSQVLDDAGQAAVVQLFADLQFAHEYPAKVAKSVAQLGTVTTPSQFNFIMKRAVHPLIQLQTPPLSVFPCQLELCKRKTDRRGNSGRRRIKSNAAMVVPPDLAQIDEKHPTRCVAAAVHFLLRKATFNMLFHRPR